MSKKDHDIILPRWILDCIENQDLLDLAPKYVLKDCLLRTVQVC